jgi:hypothetical protein
MKAAINRVRERLRTVVDAAMIFVVILLATQMWLLTATLESYLAGHTDVALPGMLVSAALFAACFALYRFVRTIDRTPGE